MSYIQLIDLQAAEVHVFEKTEVLVGRSKNADFVLTGEAAKVASSRHLRLIAEGDRWMIEDLESRNGTFLDDRRLEPRRPEPLLVGHVIRFGKNGPKFRVEAVEQEGADATVLEAEPPPRLIRPSDPTAKMESLKGVGVGVESPPEPAPAEPPAKRARAEPQTPSVRVVLVESLSGQQFDGEGGRLRLGRGRECEIQPIGAGDTSVSRLHAEIVVKPGGRVVVRDAQSRNGTLRNGEMLVGEQELRAGDRIKLGDAGPELLVTKLQIAGKEEKAAPSLKKAAAAAAGRERRSFGGKGATMFFNNLFKESERTAAKRVRRVIWVSVSVLVVAVGVLYVVSEVRVRQTAATLQQQQQEAIAHAQAVADSIQQSATAEYTRLLAELEAARGSATPAVIESLRVAVSEAQRRTALLEEALRNAQASLDQQLAAGDSIGRARQNELSELRRELRLGGSTGLGGSELDSIRAAIRAAEVRAAAVEAQVRAVRGANLAAVSQANQAAIGLVTVFMSDGVYDGSGFAITPSGYFVTNRHVVSTAGERPDSVFVTMADQRRMQRADVLVLDPSGPDIAVLKIRGYSGAHVPNVDWSGEHARQGEPAAIIGFPAGLIMALDRSRTVRTMMTGGIFSKVTDDGINFDGFTTGGSSGSPVFNADGEVVGVHFAGLSDAVGMGFAARITQLIPLLPAEARAELGLP